PKIINRSRQGSRRRFVIHKRKAFRLNYELRLEIDNVLKSWSVDKGLPIKIGDKRLAKPAADHPIEHLNFADRTTKREHVGRRVAWDLGTYELIEGNYHNGFLRFYLNGSKLKGEWTLQ